MKKLAILLIAISSLLAGCVVYDYPNRSGGYRGDHDGQYGHGDRDGGRDQHDRRSNDHDRH